MLKRIGIFFLLSTMFASTCVYAKTVEFIIDEPTYTAIENYKKETNTLLASPYIQNDRTMIPVRAVSESFGCNVEWVAESRCVNITKDERNISLTIDHNIAYVDGTEMTLDVSPRIVGDITFVPVRFVTEALDYNVVFVPATKSVLVYDSKDFAVVNGKRITAPEAEVATLLFYNSGIPSEYLTTQMQNYLIENAVLSDAADKASVPLSEKKKKDMEALLSQYGENAPFTKGAYAMVIENELKAYAYLESIANEEEINAYYQQNYVCAKHVLVAGEDDEKAKATAETVYKAAKGGFNFDALIEKYGSDPGATINPDGYVFTKGEMVAPFESMAFSLQEGKVSTPVKTSYGYHIIKRMPLPPISDEIKTSIAYTLYGLPLIAGCEITLP